ncbi:MAG: NADH-quinone oxidoreductase subunit NuoE [Firmicutes bacterium]|nr:NADH-quinone oxidoreductase subunit NuoE [Bacillota bacterium]
MDLKKKVLDIIKNKGETPDKLLEILLEVQNKTKGKYLSEEALIIISNELKIPLSKVYGVATFYSMISTKKRGKYLIQICNSSPCYLNGGKMVAKTFEKLLNIKVGETTKDNLFTLEYTSCIGACDIAPAIKINDEYYGNLTPEKIKSLLNVLREEEC